MSLRPTHGTLEHIACLVAWLLAASLLGACANGEGPTPAESTTEVVTGSITYRERIALTNAAVVEVELADVSVVDGPAEIVSTQRILRPGQVPVHFKLEYPAARIDPSHRYTVQARIREGDRLVFATDTAYPVITMGNPLVAQVAVILVGSATTESGIGNVSATTTTSLDGTLVAGNVTARYSANFENDRLVSIQEDRDLGAMGKASADYQFKEGRLLRYVELGSKPQAGGSQKTELDFAFDDTGELLAARKTLNDASSKPDKAEIDAARNRAELLRNHALALKSSREHAH
jgi:putative lipoprotein